MDKRTESVAAKKQKNSSEIRNVKHSDLLEYHVSSGSVNNHSKVSSHIEDMISNLRCPLYGKIKRIIHEKRKWWYTEFGKRQLLHPIYGLDFTVLSYNILSQTLLENHRYLYSRCKPEHLTWNYRSQNLLHEVDKYNADLMCLQEVQENHYNDTFLPYLNGKGYSGVYKKKTGNGCDGCAIFFKKSIFSLEEKYEIEFNKSTSVNVLDRNNVALIAVLKPERPSLRHLKLICATTHLLFNPRRGDIKIAQLRLLLATLQKLARKNHYNANVGEYYPIIFCGDMNSEPFYPLYDFVLRGFIKYVNVLSGNISGQSDGFNRGRFMTEEALSLAPLGINQNTCYETLNCNDNSEMSSVSVNNLKANSIIESTNKKSDSSTNAQSEYFFHPLNFTTTYKHLTESGEPEVTIKLAKQLCTVDYIFYSVNKKVSSWQRNCSEEEGVLKHIGCYGLLLESDMQEILDLPNAYLSSDHFSLLSRFLLTSK